jgi:signal transduction histidine kinase
MLRRTPTIMSIDDPIGDIVENMLKIVDKIMMSKDEKEVVENLYIYLRSVRALLDDGVISEETFRKLILTEEELEKILGGG